MDIGSSGGSPPPTRESTRLSLSLAGIFNETIAESHAVEKDGIGRFEDVYADAAPADGEEYFDNDKRRRENLFWKTTAQKYSRYVLPLVVALIGVVLVVHTVIVVQRKGREVPGAKENQNKNNVITNIKNDIDNIKNITAPTVGSTSTIGKTPTGSSSSGKNENEEDSQVRSDNIRARIADAGVTPLEVLQEASSPQHSALGWLVKDDPANLRSDHPILLERYALAVLHFSSTNAAESSLRGGWTESEHWMTSKGICDWHGVECVKREQDASEANEYMPYTQHYDDNAHVTGIRLPEHNIVGSLPSELGVLSELLALDLDKNHLEGTLPDSLTLCPRLKDLLLGGNALRGTLPVSYSALTDLHHLHLGGNNFEGTIPTEWSSALTKLRYFSVAKNDLTGTSFPDFSGMTRLWKFHLEDNHFEGSLPDWIGGLTGLLDLRIGNNQFGGPITALSSLQNLETLFLQNNTFTGTIPDMFDHLYRLHELVVDHNQFVGTLPLTLTHLQMLRTLNLSSNQLDGTIPPGLGLLTDVSKIALDHNKFWGVIPTLLGKLDDVTDLFLDHNILTGTIPSELSLCFRLKLLHLQHNALSGTVPSELGALNGLSTLRLESNMLEAGLTSGMPPQVCALRDNENLEVLCADPLVECECCTDIPTGPERKVVESKPKSF
eukprot:jgi/Psemu1/223162/e_gw1.1302.12.1